MSSIKVNIQPMGILKDYLGSRQLVLEVPENSDVQYLVSWAKAHPMVHHDLPISVVCNNEFCDVQEPLQSSILYYIIPPVSGG